MYLKEISAPPPVGILLTVGKFAKLDLSLSLRFVNNFTINIVILTADLGYFIPQPMVQLYVLF